MSNIQLKDRVLFSDGDSVVPVDTIMALLSSGVNTNGVFVDTVTEEIAQFNKFVPKNEQIHVKTSTKPIDISWKLPQEYAEIDPTSYVVQTFHEMMESDEIDGTITNSKEKRIRVIEELRLYESLNLLPVLRVLIYIINTLRNKNVVWGVGRGSSVSSYVLYVLGVHDVDSVDYDLDIHDFLRI